MSDNEKIYAKLLISFIKKELLKTKDYRGVKSDVQATLIGMGIGGFEAYSVATTLVNDAWKEMKETGISPVMTDQEAHT